MIRILCIAGPTASGKSARAVREALARDGEIISVDSRQIYRGLDIGTEKISALEMHGVPHYLIDIREPEEPYSAGEFAHDARTLITTIAARGKLPILVGGTHYYFDALLKAVPEVAPDEKLREALAKLPSESLYAKLLAEDPARAQQLDPKNRRRLVRALEIVNAHGKVPPRNNDFVSRYCAEWIVLDPPAEELRARIDARLQSALARGLIEEVRRVRARVGDARLNELGLEYRIVGEYLSTSADTTADAAPLKEALFSKLSSKLWQYARRQKAWLRKLAAENPTAGASSRPDRN